MHVRTEGRQSGTGVLAFCLLVICAILSACGQVGPLYMPGEHHSDTAPAATVSDESDTEEPDSNDKPDGL